MDLVSVIIPCYNRASLVGEAISSALDQSYEAVEIIVVDDGSTDESWSVIQSFGDAIIAIRISNGGAGRARNHGIAIARGKYLKFLDSDDLLPTDALSCLVAAAHALPEHAFIVGQVKSIDATGAPLPIDKYNYRHAHLDREVPRLVLLTECTSVSAPLFPRLAINKVGGFRQNLVLYEDYELMLRLFLADYQPHYAPILSALVREHNLERVSKTYTPEIFAGTYEMYLSIVEHFEKETAMPLKIEEQTSLGHVIWARARKAARRSYRNESDALFTLAYRVAGKNAPFAHPFLRLAYYLLSPYEAERFSEIIKALLIRRLSPLNSSANHT